MRLLCNNGDEGAAGNRYGGETEEPTTTIGLGTNKRASRSVDWCLLELGRSLHHLLTG